MSAMQGKICLITGGTNGIGKTAALALAKMGATVVIVGRKAEKTALVVEEIHQRSGNPNVSSLLADLSSQAEVRRLAAEFKEKFDHLHVLLNNAGAFYLERKLTVDGLERTFALNHLGYFLLTDLLLDTLRASAPARIINVSSDAHASGKIELDNLQGQRSFSGMSAYGNSKLANILFTTELARRLAGTGITVNAVHPGFVSTGFINSTDNQSWMLKVVGWVVPLIGRSPEKGAETSIYLASSSEVADVTGRYFVDCKVRQPAAQAQDEVMARKLWEVSEELVGLKETVAG